MTTGVVVTNFIQSSGFRKETGQRVIAFLNSKLPLLVAAVIQYILGDHVQFFLAVVCNT